MLIVRTEIKAKKAKSLSEHASKVVDALGGACIYFIITAAIKKGGVVAFGRPGDFGIMYYIQNQYKMRTHAVGDISRSPLNLWSSIVMGCSTRVAFDIREADVTVFAFSREAPVSWGSSDIRIREE